MTHRHAIEKRSEELLETLLTPIITDDVARLVLSHGDTPTDAYYPSVTCFCISAEEEVPSTGIYRARCEIHCETYAADDEAGDDLAEIIGLVRQQLQSSLEAETSRELELATIHKIFMADSLSTIEGKVRRNEIGVDLIWSPTDT